MARKQTERNERMRRDYERGDSMTAIAGRNGITCERVRQILRRMGEPARGNRKPAPAPPPAPAEAQPERTPKLMPDLLDAKAVS